MEKTTIIEGEVSKFENALDANREASAELRRQWLAIESAASYARRAYFSKAFGDDSFSKVTSLVRKLAPLAMKYVGTGGAGVVLTSLLANSGSTTGIIGLLKSLFVLPG